MMMGPHAFHEPAGAGLAPRLASHVRKSAVDRFCGFRNAAIRQNRSRQAVSAAMDIKNRRLPSLENTAASDQSP
jgi:hypothetical protein